VIFTPEDLEGSVEAPVIVPGVCHQPEGGSFLLSPSHDANGVTSKVLSFNMLVNARLVINKIFKDRESCFGGSVGHQFAHDFLLRVANAVRRQTEGLVLLEGNGVSCVLAFPVTPGGAHPSLTGSPGSVDVMFARLDDVRLAAVVGAIVSAGDETLLSPEVPSHARVTSVATVAAGETAAEQIFSGDVFLEGSLAVDAEAIGHGGDGSKSPAGAAAPLVGNVLEGGALGPLVTGVEGCGEGRAFKTEKARFIFWHEVLVIGTNSHQAFEELVGGVRMKVSSGGPGVGLGVDPVYEDLGGWRDLILLAQVEEPVHQPEGVIHVGGCDGANGEDGSQEKQFLHFLLTFWFCFLPGSSFSDNGLIGSE
jgi:hypothetical protein